MINSWRPHLEFGNWGWKFNPVPDGTHPYAYTDWNNGDYVWREHATSWGILPDGKLQIFYKTSTRYDRNRFWIPLAEEPITTDPVTGDSIVPPISRFYVLEYEDYDYEDQETLRYMQPRVNIQQEFEVPAYDVYEFCTFDPICTKTP